MRFVSKERIYYTLHLLWVFYQVVSYIKEVQKPLWIYAPYNYRDGCDSQPIFNLFMSTAIVMVLHSWWKRGDVHLSNTAWKLDPCNNKLDTFVRYVRDLFAGFPQGRTYRSGRSNAIN